MAARRDGEERVWVGVPFERAHRELVAWMRPDDVLVGHNLHAYDRPQIAQRAPNSPLLRLPTLDTLELSVLSHPGRPYHRLTKDDQLVRDARPNPLSDVRASEVVLQDALRALRDLPDPERDLLRALIPRIPLDPTAVQGWRVLFAALDWAWEPVPLDLAAAWRGRVCAHAPLLADPPLDPGLVMLSAWLRVAARNDGSVLPGWVRRQWPQTPDRIRALRATPCHDPACEWCRVNLSPEHWLSEVFGFDAFRPEPAAPDGQPLQQVLVDRGLRGEPTFGILPTGGGKSLCFQIPAEARYRLLGQLTVVISPLQSLMKDQVDGLRDRIPHARALYSGLPALLRPQVLDEVRTGACGLLYLSPEQFRNKSILTLLTQREVGAIVFDEAHCLSQWGHDFRTDYPYVLKAVRRCMEGQGLPVPPVFLFTATTQHDATQQILDHVAEQTGARPELFDGGSARDNLTYQVRAVPEVARMDVIVELLGDHLDDGTAIVFCGSRKRAETTAAELTDRGFPAVAYHAGLEAEQRREVQNAFLAGQHRVITATNAFGMGVDKPDVRLVVHLDMPSSLEAYLQEAGRAGRDRKPALAVLLWAPGDAEPRFALGSMSDLSYDDLEALWRAIRQLPAMRVQGIERRVVTPRELLFQDALQGRFDPFDAQEETRVKAGVNWLETLEVLERRENVTRVFTGKPRPPTLEAARTCVEGLDLPPMRKVQWLVILERLYAAGDEGLSADDLAVLAKEMSEEDPLEGGLRVLSILKQMAERRIVSAGQTFTVLVSHGTQDSSQRRLERAKARELALFDHATGGELDDTQVHLKSIADQLSALEDGRRCTERVVGRLLAGWSTASQGMTRATGTVRFRQHRGAEGRLEIDATQADLERWIRTRHEVAQRALDALIARVEGTGHDQVVDSKLEDIAAAVEADLFLLPRLQNVGEAARSAIAWMHELEILRVQNGLAIFRSAMRLDRDPSKPTPHQAEARQRAKALEEYAEHKILRVHVMQAWARRMQTSPAEAEALRADWFALPVADFQARWFPHQKEQLARPTTPESYHAIVTALNDPVQEKIVTRDARRNHLVLAGPGSGKTRILVHRVAWLLRVRRVRARQILVVCYTRANALELRRRLLALVGNDARFVRVRTLHSVAMEMVGAHRLGPDGDLTLESCLKVAAALLRGEPLDDAEQVRHRDALLDGVQYLFVDEYQDIDADKYELLSAIAGRAMGGDQRKLRVFAVGDDDQAIFTWDGASTDFIRSFEQDYRAARFVVPHNYRNPRAVLELAQGLILGLPGRLKADHTLTVDAARAKDPPLGPWAHDHLELRGRIPWTRHSSVRQAAWALMETVRRWLDEGVPPREIGVLTRTRPHGLHRLRIAAEAQRVPFTWPLPSDATVPIGQIREVVSVFDLLAGSDGDSLRADAIAHHLAELGTGTWAQALRSWLEPHEGRRLTRAEWRYDLLAWSRLERRARTLGDGVHLGTLHSAKGLEFEHVLLLDDGGMEDTPEHRRLLYVALTRARRSLQLFSSYAPSPTWLALRHPLLDQRDAPDLAADAPDDHEYGLIGREDIWIDWLGLQRADHEGHRAMTQARPGDPFTLVVAGRSTSIVDGQGRIVGRLSAKGAERWAPRARSELKLKLVAVVRERSSDAWREEKYRERLIVDAWWTGVWEARWRARGHVPPPAGDHDTADA